MTCRGRAGSRWDLTSGGRRGMLRAFHRPLGPPTKARPVLAFSAACSCPSCLLERGHAAVKVRFAGSTLSGRVLGTKSGRTRLLPKCHDTAPRSAPEGGRVRVLGFHPRLAAPQKTVPPQPLGPVLYQELPRGHHRQLNPHQEGERVRHAERGGADRRPLTDVGAEGGVPRICKVWRLKSGCTGLRVSTHSPRPGCHPG